MAKNYSLSDIKNRLWELGYCHYNDNEQLFRIALKRYQLASGLTVTGYSDKETINKLFGEDNK